MANEIDEIQEDDATQRHSSAADILYTHEASDDGPRQISTPDSTQGKRRARTPLTPDSIRSRAKTPDAISGMMHAKIPDAISSIVRTRPRTAELNIRSTAHIPSSQQERAQSACKLRKPKVFVEEDFKKFLARQNQHKAMQAKYYVIPNGLIRGLRMTPLLPISNAHGYCIQGAVYIDADWRNRAHQGKVPSWLGTCIGKVPSYVSGKTRTTPVDASFQSFLHRQNESLERKAKRCNSAPPEVKMMKASQEEIEEFIKRKKDEVGDRSATLLKMQETFMAEVCLSTKFAQKMHCKEAVQPAEFLHRHYKRIDEERSKNVQKARAKWKMDYGHECGESNVLDNQKVVTSAQAEAIYLKLAEFPNVSNREPPNREPKVYEPVFRSSGNPYQGGKADFLSTHLGDKACLAPLPASIE